MSSFSSTKHVEWQNAGRLPEPCQHPDMALTTLQLKNIQENLHAFWLYFSEECWKNRQENGCFKVYQLVIRSPDPASRRPRKSYPWSSRWCRSSPASGPTFLHRDALAGCCAYVRLCKKRRNCHTQRCDLCEKSRRDLRSGATATPPWLIHRSLEYNTVICRTNASDS